MDWIIQEVLVYMDEKIERALEDIKELVEGADKRLKEIEPEMKAKVKEKQRDDRYPELFELRDDGSCKVRYHDGTQEKLNPIEISFKPLEKEEEE